MPNRRSSKAACHALKARTTPTSACRSCEKRPANRHGEMVNQNNAATDAGTTAHGSGFEVGTLSVTKIQAKPAKKVRDDHMTLRPTNFDHSAAAPVKRIRVMTPQAQLGAINNAGSSAPSSATAVRIRAISIPLANRPVRCRGLRERRKVQLSSDPPAVRPKWRGAQAHDEPAHSCDQTDVRESGTTR